MDTGDVSEPSREGKTRGNCDKTDDLETWESPRLIPLDLGSAQAKYCMFNIESALDNGPKVAGCSS